MRTNSTNLSSCKINTFFQSLINFHGQIHVKIRTFCNLYKFLWEKCSKFTPPPCFPFDFHLFYFAYKKTTRTQGFARFIWFHSVANFHVRIHAKIQIFLKFANISNIPQITLEKILSKFTPKKYSLCSPLDFSYLL